MDEKKRPLRGIPGSIVSMGLIAFGVWMLWQHFLFAGAVVLLVGLWLLPFFLRAFSDAREDSADKVLSSWSRMSMSSKGASRMADAPFRKPIDY